jgi:hypothetical protein
MSSGNHRLGLVQAAGPCAAVAQIGGVRDRALDQRALRLAVGAMAARSQPADALAVGLEQRHVDAVEGGAAHQTDRGKRLHAFILGSHPTVDLLHQPRQTGD